MGRAENAAGRQTHLERSAAWVIQQAPVGGNRGQGLNVDHPTGQGGVDEGVDGVDGDDGGAVDDGADGGGARQTVAQHHVQRPARPHYLYALSVRGMGHPMVGDGDGRLPRSRQ